MPLFIFALVLMIVGGAIAYLGDWLGTRIGKKRNSLFGLRPRHTANLVTVIAGSLTALLTYLILIGVNKEVRIALQHGGQILAENKRLNQQNKGLQASIALSGRQAADAVQRAFQAQRKADAAEAQARGMLRRAAVAERRANAAQVLLAASLRRLSAAQKGLTTARADLIARQADLRAARARLTDARTALGRTRRGLEAARAELARARRSVAAADLKVRTAQRQYDQALSTVADLSRRGDQLFARNADLTQANAAMEAKNQSLSADNARLTAQNQFLQGAQLLFYKDQEVGRRVIATDASIPAIRQSLAEFLTALSDRAAQAGGKTGDNGRAVLLVPAGGGAESEDLDDLAQSIASQASQTESVVVIAEAQTNAFKGEQTKIILRPYQNVLVFYQGEVIARTRIDGTQREDLILSQIQAFLRSQVQALARKRGVIPRPDPATGELVVGEPTDSAKTLALVQKIEHLGPNAVVTAAAAEDTRSSGPLRIDLSADGGVGEG